MTTAYLNRIATAVRCASIWSGAEVDFGRRVSPCELPELMDGECSYEDFRDCLGSLEQINRWLLGYRPTLAWLNRLQPGSGDPLQIVDVGCGGGGLLRQISAWARRSGIAVELTGIDLNPYAARVAAESTPKDLGIAWVTGDALEYRSEKAVDIVVSSLMAHHLEDEEVVELLRWLEATAKVGWFINDLERSAGNCRMFERLGRVTGWHRFVRHDAPVSFRRAFRKDDWLRLTAMAAVPQHAAAVEHWLPGRLCVGRWKRPVAAQTWPEGADVAIGEPLSLSLNPPRNSSRLTI